MNDAAGRIDVGRVRTTFPTQVLAEIATSSDTCLRWQAGRHSWRHRRDGGFDQSHYSVERIPERDAKSFVTEHHYSKAYPAAVNRYGLFDLRDLRLVGVAVFGIPVQASVLTSALPSLVPYRQSQELSRFVLLDECPANSESWFLARCFTSLLDAGVKGVVSFADPVPRHASDGTVIAPGHVGTIYQASGAHYTGRGTARTLTLLPDGTVLNARAMQKIRRQESGHEHVERKLVSHGARPPGARIDMSDWLREALHDIGTSRLRHRGPHRYVFRLGRNARERAKIPLGMVTASYPKTIDNPSDRPMHESVMDTW